MFDLVSALSQIKQRATGHGWWSKNTQCIVFRWEIHHHHCTFWIQPFCSTFKSCAPLSRTYVIISYTMITYLLHSGCMVKWLIWDSRQKGVCIGRNIHWPCWQSTCRCKEITGGKQDTCCVHSRVHWRIPHLFLLPPSLLPSTPLPVRSMLGYPFQYAIILNLWSINSEWQHG